MTDSREPTARREPRTMPCYLFTLHAHGSWMPDHRRGFVHRGDGILAPDKHMADLYRANLKQDVVRFDAAIQRQLIDGAREASACLHLRCHFVSTEPTHVHILVSWSHDRPWREVRRQLGGGLTRRLNRAVKRHTWFAKSPSRKRVRDRGHFHYLMTDYLVKHSGLKWSETRGDFPLAQ